MNSITIMDAVKLEGRPDLVITTEINADLFEPGSRLQEVARLVEAARLDTLKTAYELGIIPPACNPD